MQEDKKRIVDWKQIEKDYRAGIKSNRQIADEHGIVESAIRKQSNKYGWTKDLASLIRAKAADMVRIQEVRNAVRNKVDDAQVVEENAQIQANVIRSHRKSIGKYTELCNKLFAEIEVQTGNVMTFEDFGEIMFAPDDKGQDKRNELYSKIISNPSRVDSTKKLVEMLKTLISLEREAFSIDADETGNQTLESWLSGLD